MRSRFALGVILSACALFFGAAPAFAASGPHTSSISTDNSTATYTPDTEECAFLTTINSYRAKAGLSQLTLSVTLGAAANHHSNDMATQDYFSHTLINGTAWDKNIANYGYPSSTSRGENIAAGHAAAADAFTQWKNSPPHNANMLGAKYNAIGIGRAYGKDSTYGWYWTTTFGSVVDSPTTCAGTSTSSAPVTYGFVGGGHTSASTTSLNATDGDPSTSWHTTGSTPRSAYVYFDLGKTRAIGNIQWMFAKTGCADSYTIQVSTDKTNWTTIATYGNAKTAGSWLKLTWSGNARYVRFSFSNPNKDTVLGYLAEVKVGP